MPMYGFRCGSCERTEEHYFSVREAAPTVKCEKCGSLAERDLLVEARTHVPASGYPHFTKHLNGKLIEVKSAAHHAELCKQYGKVLRDDAAFIEEGNEYTPTLVKDARTGKWSTKIVYHNGTGMGRPGCWV